MAKLAGRTAVLGVIAVAFCGGAFAAPSPVAVRDGWIRPTAIGADGAGYLTLVNHGRSADTLTALSSPDAAAASLHESKMVGAVMTMRRLSLLALPAGGSVAFKPGGLHVMLHHMKRALRAGDRTVVVLTFAKAGRVRAVLRVGQVATPGPMAGMTM